MATASSALTSSFFLLRIVSLSLNALGFLAKMAFLISRIISEFSWVFQQLKQEQAEVHSLWLRKHSQYNFLHWDFFQVHPFACLSDVTESTFFNDTCFFLLAFPSLLLFLGVQTPSISEFDFDSSR